MNTPSFSILETVKLAWNKTKGSKRTFWAVIFFVLLVAIFTTLIDMGIKMLNPGFLMLSLVILRIFFTPLSWGLSWGLFYLGIKRAQDQPIQVGMINHTLQFRLIFKLVRLFFVQLFVLLPAVFILFLPTIFHATLMTLADSGTVSFKDFLKIATALTYIIAMIVFGYLMLRMYLAKSIVIAENIGPWTAVKKSFKATKSNVLKLIALTFINFGIIVLSILPLCIGLAWSLPYYYISNGMVYRKLIVEADLK